MFLLLCDRRGGADEAAQADDGKRDGTGVRMIEQNDDLVAEILEHDGLLVGKWTIELRTSLDGQIRRDAIQ